MFITFPVKRVKILLNRLSNVRVMKQLLRLMRATRVAIRFGFSIEN